MGETKRSAVSQWCKGKSWHNRIGFTSCSNRATRDGWCGVHHPDAVARREQRIRERAAARARANDELWKRRMEKARKMDGYDAIAAERDRLKEQRDELLKALRDGALPSLESHVELLTDMAEMFDHQDRWGVRLGAAEMLVAELRETIAKAETT